MTQGLQLASPELLAGKRLPPRGSILGLIFLVAGFMGLFRVLIPPFSPSPAPTVVLGVFAIVLGVMLLIAPKPILYRRIVIFSTLCTLVLASITAFAVTSYGVAMAAMPFLWLSVYFGTYFEPKVTRIQVALLCVVFGIAAAVVQLPSFVIFFLIFCFTVVVTTETLAAINGALRDQARLDPLTRLLNRNGLAEVIRPIFALVRRKGDPISLAIIDIDDFKQINDSLGHQAGDQVLVGLARSWSETKREADLLARFGGDEFVLVMPSTRVDQAEVLIDRLRRADDTSWSYGVVEVEPSEDLDSSLRRADRLLYAAKEKRHGAGAAVG